VTVIIATLERSEPDRESTTVRRIPSAPPPVQSSVALRHVRLTATAAKPAEWIHHFVIPSLFRSKDLKSADFTAELAN
jgi:hypothetical protein